jgi:plastocyanin
MMVTIANTAVSPQAIVVPRGSQVTFLNNDNRAHNIQSDPHPEHTDCPEIGQVGFLNPGQSRQTGNLNVTRTCRYHDHLAPDVKSLLGTILIQ